LHPSIAKWIGGDVNFKLYILFILFLIIVLLFPSLERIKTKEIELELQTSPQIGFVLSLAEFEGRIGELKKRTEKPISDKKSPLPWLKN